MKHFKRTILSLLIIFLLLVGVTAKATNEMNEDPYERLVIAFLSDDIHEAVNNYNDGELRGLDLYSAKISELESLHGWSNFNVTVEVESFFGPHNPPYGVEIMTFHIGSDNKPTLINYEHQEIEP